MRELQWMHRPTHIGSPPTVIGAKVASDRTTARARSWRVGCRFSRTGEESEGGRCERRGTASGLASARIALALVFPALSLGMWAAVDDLAYEISSSANTSTSTPGE